MAEKTKFDIWRDRIAHGAVAAAGPIMSAIPLLASPLALLFLITREYYQTKRNMDKAFALQGNTSEPKFTEVMEFISWDKDDLVDAYVGTALGLIIGIIIVWAMI